MFKKIVEFFTGKKPQSKYAHPLDAVTTPAVPQAPYKLEPPAEITTLLYVPPETVPIPYRFQPPAAETIPPVAVLISPEVEQQKKPRRPAVKKPAVITAPAEKKPAKPRAKKTPE
jgi:hypothetical protein